MRVLHSRILGGTVALCVLAFLSGCGGSSKNASHAGSNPSTGGAPSANATVTFVSASGSNLLADPHTYAGGLTGWEIYTQLYDRLIQLSSDDKTLEPMLATSWKWNSTNTQLTVTLRKGVQFQDGTPFNADVAVANLKAGSAKASNGAAALALMTGVIAVDPYTIRLTFSGPDPDAVFAMEGYPGMEVSLAGLANPKTLTTQPAGSGPYKLVSVSAALTFTMDRWDGYWNKSHIYPAQYVETSVLNETTRLNAVRTGQNDFALISATTINSAQADKSLQVVKYPEASPFVVFMNNKLHPFDNPQVRQAVSLAFDRDAFNASQSGLCTPVSQALPPGLVSPSKSSGAATSNVTEAKQLIQSAGATGTTVKLLTITFEPYPTFARIVQNQLDAIGLNVQIVTLPAGGTFRILYQNGGYGMLLGTLSLSAPDPSQILDMFVTGIGNPGTKDSALAAKIEKAEQLPLGSSARTAAMQAIDEDLSNPSDMLWVTLCQSYYIIAGTKSLIGLGSAPNGIFGGFTFSYLQVTK